MKKITMTGALLAALIGSTAMNASETDLLQFARISATTAGGAQYCNADEELIEEFIAKAEARLSLLAKDEYEKVLGRLEFKNVLAGASAREPEVGCDAFVKSFEQAVRDAR